MGVIGRIIAAISVSTDHKGGHKQDGQRGTHASTGKTPKHKKGGKK